MNSYGPLTPQHSPQIEGSSFHGLDRASATVSMCMPQKTYKAKSGFTWERGDEKGSQQVPCTCECIHITRATFVTPPK